MQTNWILDSMGVDQMIVDQMENRPTGCRPNENKPMILCHYKIKQNTINSDQINKIKRKCL